MGLLDQLFRHKSDLPGASSVPEDPAQSTFAIEAGTRPKDQVATRNLGAIAAAIGLRPDRGTPAEFEIALGDLLQRTPEKFVWPGSHDARRILRVPAAEITAGLAKGRAELPLARLIALAPDVFRCEAGDSGDARVRLPLQKLLQQIGSGVPAADSVPTAQDSFRGANPAAAAGGECVTAHLPSIVWEKLAVTPGAESVAADAAKQSQAAVVNESAADRSVKAESGPTPIFASVESARAGQSESIPAKPTQQQPIFATEEPPRKSLELRPHTDVSISTTLRAVVLGGHAVTQQGGGADAANPVLAPHAPPDSSAPSIVLAPAGPKAAAIVGAPKIHAASHPGGDAPVTLEPPATLPREPAASSAAMGENVNFSALQSLFMTDATLDLAGVAAKVATLPGIHACVVSVADGFAQAGHFPSGLDADALRAIVQDPGGSAGESVSRTSVGAVANTTLHRGDRAISVFVRDRVSLTVVLDASGFVAGVRERIARATDYLAGAVFAE